MKIFVTAYELNAHLLDCFHKLANKFWGAAMIVDVAPKGEAKSEQLRRMFANVDDEYVTLLEEDFWLVEDVPLNLIFDIWQFCQHNKVDRFSLQSKNAYKFSDWTLNLSLVQLEIGVLRVYKTESNKVAMMGLDASVWKLSYLLNNLGTGQDDAAMERIRPAGATVYALDRFVLQYRDAIRRGEQVLQLHEDPLRLTGPQLALYPQGGGSEELIL